jgi:hypothetical protein
MSILLNSFDCIDEAVVDDTTKLNQKIVMGYLIARGFTNTVPHGDPDREGIVSKTISAGYWISCDCLERTIKLTGRQTSGIQLTMIVSGKTIHEDYEKLLSILELDELKA